MKLINIKDIIINTDLYFISRPITELCSHLNKNYIGVELDKDYYNTAINRIQNNYKNNISHN